MSIAGPSNRTVRRALFFLAFGQTYIFYISTRHFPDYGGDGEAKITPAVLVAFLSSLYTVFAPL